MKLPFSPWIIAGTFLAGSFGGGWIVHKVWYGKAAADKAKLAQASQKALEDDLAETKRLLIKSSEAAEREATARLDAENRLSRAYDDNARLAQSRASVTTRIIEKGDEIGNELKANYPCIYEPWPDKLRDYAFRQNDTENMPATFAGGYPARD